MEAKLSKAFIEEVIQQTSLALEHWKNLAKERGVLKENIEFIEKRIAKF